MDIFEAQDYSAQFTSYLNSHTTYTTPLTLSTSWLLIKFFRHVSASF